MIDNKAGLRGQIAGVTKLCTVGKSGTGLTYCGYDISELAEKATFEEVAWLLSYGVLPTKIELMQYKQTLKAARVLPVALKSCLESLPASAHPMDVLRTGCSVLGSLEPEVDFVQQQAITARLLGIFPSILLYWYQYSHHNKKIETETDDDSIAGHFLHLLYGEKPTWQHYRCLDVSLILYAEHEFNASTFTARVCASTLSDMYSCITGAIGSLRGPLHGGANEAAMAMIEKESSPESASLMINKRLANKEKIMGFGHAIYKAADPRSAIIKAWSQKLAVNGRNHQLFLISQRIEEMLAEKKGLFPNADFYHATAYHCLKIPTSLFTPIFVCSRVSGWAAHVMEQRSHNRIIRPSAEYIGPSIRPWIAIEKRVESKKLINE